MVRLDKVTALTVRALSAGGVRSILLKGPAIARTLYRESDTRPYWDADLLIDPATQVLAGTILWQLGFRDVHADLSERERIPYAQLWARPSDGAVIDLHHTLLEAQIAPALVWSLLADNTVRWELGGEEVEILPPSGLAMLVGLHAAHHGGAAAQPMQDLSLALERIGHHDWEAGALLARALGADGALGAGLRLLPAGVELAQSLGLPERTSIFVALRAASAPHTAEGFARLFATPGLLPKLRALRRELVPTPDFVRLHWPVARHGRLGLAAGYLQRLIQLVAHAGPGLFAVRKARKAEADKHT